MTSRGSVVLVIAWRTDHLRQTDLYNLNLEIKKLEMMADENKPARCRGRARGLVAVWEEERRNQLWINNSLPSRCIRAETLRIMIEMATRNDQRPRDRPLQPLALTLEGVLVM